jgi:hypothetical protein
MPSRTSANQDVVLDQVNTRLDAIISLLLEILETDDKPMSIARRIEILGRSPLRPSDIARITGKPLRDVTSVLARKRKSRRKI